MERVSTLTDVGDDVITMLLSTAKLFHSLAVSLPDPCGHALRFTLTGVIESKSVDSVGILHLYIRHHKALRVQTFLGFFKSFFVPQVVVCYRVRFAGGPPRGEDQPFLLFFLRLAARTTHS